MRWLALGLSALALVLQGCQGGPQASRDLGTAASPDKRFELWFCKLNPVAWRDNDNDGVLGVGDAIVYTATLARKPSCAAADQTTVFSGVEEVVQRPSEQSDGSMRYLTNFQGTLKLAEGNLQLRGLQSFLLKPEQSQALKTGQAVMRLLDVLPESESFTVVGGGDQFAGLVGTASYDVNQPGRDPLALRITLYRQANR
jgi:hypothetical protein